jgi:hypothetical protein
MAVRSSVIVPPPTPLGTPHGSERSGLTRRRRAESSCVRTLPSPGRPPLRGLWTRLKGPGFYRDGTLKDLTAVVDHYKSTMPVEPDRSADRGPGGVSEVGVAPGPGRRVSELQADAQGSRYNGRTTMAKVKVVVT